MEDKAGALEAKFLEDLTEFLSAHLTEGGYQVIPRDQIRQRLLDAKKDSYKACYDQTCQIELGRELAAQKTLSTKIMKIGQKCQITSILYDLKKSATERAATASAACEGGAMLEAIQKVAAKLCEDLKPKDTKKSEKDEKTLKQLAKLMPGTISVRSEPEGAEIQVDGKLIGRAPMKHEIAPGEYDLSAGLDGYHQSSKKVKLEPGGNMEVKLSLKKVTSLWKWGHVAFWPGVALVGFGGISMWQARAAKDDYDGGDRDAKSRNELWNGLMYTGFALGGAAMAAGAVIWILAAGDAPDEEGGTTVGILPTSGGTGVMVVGSW
jgi:hypothetical protein